MFQTYMGVSKNSGTPIWMVYNGNPIKMDVLGNTYMFVFKLLIFQGVRTKESWRIQTRTDVRR